MTKRTETERQGLPEWADRLREWLEELLPAPAPEPAVVPVPVRPSASPSARRRRRR